MVLAAIALFLGGVPVLRVVIPISFLAGLVGTILTLSWLISGVVSVYWLYRWNKGKKLLFGRRKRLDTVVFFIAVISGLNLGFAGLSGNNLGMIMSSSTSTFVIVGLLYLASAAYLLKQYRRHNEKIF